MFQFLLEWLGAPPLIKQLREEISDYKLRIISLEEERSRLLDGFLIREGVRPIKEEERTQVLDNTPPSPFKEWEKNDVRQELEELRRMADVDPTNWLPIYEDAMTTYAGQVNLND
jgi:hypothetical protein